MKKRFIAVSILALGVLTLASCGNTTFDTTNAIKLYSRDDKSGTRDGFFTKIGYEDAKTDNSLLKSTVSIVANNGAMITSIANDPYGIGYISLSTLESNDKIKGLNYEGVVPSEANVLSGDYQLTRNFNYIIRSEYADSNVGDIVEAFVAYMNTREGKTIMQNEAGILTISNTDPSWNDIKDDYPIVNDATLNLEVKVGGSTSVSGMSEALTDAFAGLLASDNVSFNHNHTGSGDAYKNTQGSGKDSATSLDIGFLSREIELTGDEPAAANTYGKMCTDAIVAVVNVANPYSDTTAKDLVSMYSVTGEGKVWSDFVK